MDNQLEGENTQDEAITKSQDTIESPIHSGIRGFINRVKEAITGNSTKEIVTGIQTKMTDIQRTYQGQDIRSVLEQFNEDTLKIDQSSANNLRVQAKECRIDTVDFDKIIRLIDDTQKAQELIKEIETILDGETETNTKIEQIKQKNNLLLELKIEEGDLTAEMQSKIKKLYTQYNQEQKDTKSE